MTDPDVKTGSIGPFRLKWIPIRHGPRHPAEPAFTPTPAHLALALVGGAAGAMGAIATYQRSADLWLTLYVFGVAAYVLGRGLAEILTRPHKSQRALYVLLRPLFATAAVYLGLLLGAPSWLAVIAGSGLGAGAAILLGWLLLPAIAAEEEPIVRLSEPTSSDLGYRWWRRHHKAA